MTRASRVCAISFALALGVSLAGCAGESSDEPEAPVMSDTDGGDTEPDNADEDDVDSDAPESEKGDANDVSGSFTVEGETFEAESGWCTFVAVEDAARVYVEFPEGDAMFNAPASAEVTLSDGRGYSVSLRDTDPNIEVSADGVSGESSAYVAESGTEYVPIEVDITCHYD